MDWIQDFCSNRTGRIVLGGYEGPTQAIEHAGTPQGSPLSPLLYVFYNANLVEGPINHAQGSIGFVDDYNAWVIGPSPAENIRLIQGSIIPLAEKWSNESGAVFEAVKTGLVHFTRDLVRRQDSTPLHFNGVEIVPTDSIKILGVLFDCRRHMRSHVEKVSIKAIQACIQLQGVKGLRP